MFITDLFSGIPDFEPRTPGIPEAKSEVRYGVWVSGNPDFSRTECISVLVISVRIIVLILFLITPNKFC